MYGKARMSGFEMMVATSGESLLESLQFKLPDSSNFVTRRRSRTWYPTGDSTCSPTGTRTVRFLIAGNDWLDLSSMRVVQTVRNLHTTRALNPRTDGCDTGESTAASPALLWDRQRLFASGELIDDQLYASHVEMMLRRRSPGNF